jgi:hypothetical protein
LSTDLERLLADEGLGDFAGQGLALVTFGEITDDALKGIGVERLVGLFPSPRKSP